MLEDRAKAHDIELIVDKTRVKMMEKQYKKTD